VEVLLAIAAFLVVLYGLHRLALLAEDRGWIYYKRRKASTSALGSAFLEVQSLLEPEKQQLAEVQKAEKFEEDDQGEPPEPGAD
jgi:hypothetical protein